MQKYVKQINRFAMQQNLDPFLNAMNINNSYSIYCKRSKKIKI